MLNKRAVVFFLLLNLPVFLLSAHTGIGNVITYRYLSASTYEVKVFSYRDCRTTPLSLSEPVYARCSGTKVQLNMRLLAIKEVTYVCATEPGRCNPPNTYATGNGIEEHVFIDTVNFNDSKFNSLNCAQVYFEFGMCCRSSDITTGSANSNFYNYAWLNRNLAEGNSSPQITLPPVIQAPQNQNVFYHSGLMDTLDRDSVSYSLEAPLSSFGNTISYSTGYSKDKPIEAYWPAPLKYPYANANTSPVIGITFDAETGQMIYMPTRTTEIATIVIQATEWRKDSSGKMQIVGIVRSDFIHKTVSFPDNYAPNITGPATYKTCVGQRICFNINTNDQVFTPPPPKPKPAPDTVILRWSHVIKGATLNIVDPKARLQSAQFCWTPSDSDALDIPHRFIMEARDNACPIRSMARKVYQIQVSKRPKFDAEVMHLNCNKVAYSIIPDSTIKETLNYTAEIFNEQMQLISDFTLFGFSDGKQSSSRKSDTLSFYMGGKFYLRLSALGSASGCAYTLWDTLNIQGQSHDLITVTDTFHCEGDSLKLLADGYNPSSGLTNIQWHTSFPTDTAKLAILHLNQSLAWIRLTARDKEGCEVTDFVRIQKFTKPQVSLGSDLTLCGKYTYTLKPEVTGYFPNIPVKFSWQDQSSADSLVITANGMHWVRTSNICGSVADTIFVFDRNNLLQPKADVHYCEGDTITLNASLKEVKYRWNNVTYDSAGSISVSQSGAYQCRMILTCGDTLMEQFNVIEEHKPQLYLPEWASFCRGDSVAVSAGWWDAYTTISWNDQNTDSIRYFSSPGWYQFHASNVCGVFGDTIEIRQINPPMVNLGNDTLYCSAFSHIVQLPDTTHQYTWSDATTGPNHTFSAPGVYWVKAKSTCGDAEDTITISQSFVPSVNLGNDTALKAPFSLTLNAGNVGAMRKWSNADTSESITVNAFGTYWVQVNTPCGVATDTINISNMLSVQIDNYKGLKVYPNPTADKLNLISDRANVKAIEIYDRLGKLYGYEDYARAEIKDIELNLVTCPPGMYILKIELMNGENAVVPVAIIR